MRLLVDTIGSARLGRRFLQPLRKAGAEIAWFNPIGLARFRPDLLNFRTHRKIIVCDGSVGFTGGINICDNHSKAARRELAWRDTHVRIEGSPVRDLQVAFLEDWHFATGTAPCDRDHFPEADTTGTGPWVQVLASGPDHDSYAIERFCFAAIAGAKHRVLITTPYFVPNESLLAALTTAAMRGVDVQVLVPKRSDSWLVTAAARSYFEELARQGVRFHEYGPPMLHAKTLVVDDEISLVGTANMDNRSFRLNFEIAAVFYDRGISGYASSNVPEGLVASYVVPFTRSPPSPLTNTSGRVVRSAVFTAVVNLRTLSSCEVLPQEPQFVRVIEPMRWSNSRSGLSSSCRWRSASLADSRLLITTAINRLITTKTATTMKLAK